MKVSADFRDAKKNRYVKKNVLDMLRRQKQNQIFTPLSRTWAGNYRYFVRHDWTILGLYTCTIPESFNHVWQNIYNFLLTCVREGWIFGSVFAFLAYPVRFFSRNGFFSRHENLHSLSFTFCVWLCTIFHSFCWFRY